MKKLCLIALISFPFWAQEGDLDKEMAAAMQKQMKYITPGPHHEFLKKFIGKWDTEMRIIMGGQETPPMKGAAEYSWLFPGRWVQSKWNMPMMGMPVEGFTIMGYDNFKMSYVSTTVTTMDTAMNSNEGDLDPDGKTMLLYGTVDEYLTGEHDKMSKTVFHFESDDKFVMEVHDFAIGKDNTKVVEVRFTRK